MNGFIALTSVVIISVILLVVTVGGSLTGFYSRSAVLDTELKERSAALADACADVVLLRLAGDASYAGPEIVSVGNDSCQIFASSNPSDDPRSFVVQAAYRRTYTTLELSANVDAATLISRQEIPTYP